MSDDVRHDPRAEYVRLVTLRLTRVAASVPFTVRVWCEDTDRWLTVHVDARG